MSDAPSVAGLLRRWRAGDDAAYGQLMPLVYGELRRLARSQLRRERPEHSLQPTALVHEAYLRLVRADVDWQDRTHFLRVAARALRQILVEHARARRARKRGGNEPAITLSDPLAVPDATPGVTPVDVLALHGAMDRLESLDARAAQIVELCYFGGLTYPEIAEALAVSEATVHRDLRHARAWLRAELSGEAPA